MRLITLSSGSKGNSYILDVGSECLVIEAGMPYGEIEKALRFNILKISGCIISHKHQDHAKYTDKYEYYGIKTFKPYENGERAVKLGGFTINAVEMVHDVPCFGFLVAHKELGRFFYASDTEYVKYRFKNLNHMLIECNYDGSLISDDAMNFEHVLTGHMSLQTCKDFVKANTHGGLQNVILCHMSDKNINEDKAIDEIKSATNARVFSAHTDKDINLSIAPF